MSTHKRFDLICIVVIICALLVTVLFMNGEKLGIVPTVDEDSPYYTGPRYFSTRDQDSSWDSALATAVINMEGDTAQIDGNGAYTVDGNVYITANGVYVLSGKLDDGSIIIDAYTSSKVQLVLNGADVYCSDDAALFVKKAEKVFVTLADGTVNRLASGSEYSDNAKVKNRKSVVFSKTDLTINGNGSLEINGEYMHGLEIDNDFAATGGTINISAPEDGIKADKSIKLANADITIECTDDGMSTDEIEGYIYIESGYVYVNCSDNGIWSAGDIIIAGGDTTVYAGDAGLYAGGSFNIKDGELTAIVDDVDGNYGIEAYNDINILGGSVKISLLNNGFSQDVRWGESSEGVLNINGGSLIAAGDKSAVSSAGDIQGSQGAVLCTSSSGIHSGTQIYLCDENGDALLSWAAPCSFSSLLISCPEMSVGGTYYVVVGGIDSAVTLDEKLAFWDDSQS